jgi:imidazolonepropionase-like amidohydrolase
MQKANEMYEDAARTLEAAMKADVRIAMGSDAGAFGHGHNGAEVKHLVDAGLTPMQAIVAGTKTASECLEMEHEIGTLEAGKLADVLVVDGDPLADPSLLDGGAHLTLVLKGGTAHVNRLAPSPPAPFRLPSGPPATPSPHDPVHGRGVHSIRLPHSHDRGD